MGDLPGASLLSPLAVAEEGLWRSEVSFPAKLLVDPAVFLTIQPGTGLPAGTQGSTSL